MRNKGQDRWLAYDSYKQRASRHAGARGIDKEAEIGRQTDSRLQLRLQQPQRTSDPENP
jgi:hypothetical protein